MKLEYLNYILEIVDLGSISAASKTLWIGQSTLSMAVKAVESELGFRLFTRTPSGVRLTPQGGSAIVTIRKMVENYNKLCTMTGEYNTANPTCSIACYPGLCPALGSYLIRALSGEPHNAILNMKGVLSRKTMTALVNGTTNIGIGTVPSGELVDEKAFATNNNLKVEEIYTDNLVICVSASSKFAERESVDFSELGDIKFSTTSYAPHFTGFFPPLDFRLFRMHSVYDTEESVKRTVMTSDVAMFLPDLCVRNDIYVKHGLIKALKLTGFDTRLINFIAYPDADVLTPIEQTAIGFIREFYSSAGYTVDQNI